jgi:hypothetical protein
MAFVQTFDFSVDLLTALLWRNNNSDNITALLQAKQNWYDENQEQFWTDWYNNVFYLPTANQFGLSVWSIILGLPINLQGSIPVGPTPFGFGMFNSNFGNSNFSPNQSNPDMLTIADARWLLQLRYWRITSRQCVMQDNVFLAWLFGAGNVGLVDNLNMSITCYYKASVISANLLAAIQASDVMPRASTVAISYATI